MARFTTAELDRKMFLGIGVLGVSALVAAIAAGVNDENHHAYDHLRFLCGLGTMTALAALLWTGLAAALRFTRYFDVRAAITSQVLGVSLTAIAIGTVVLLSVMLAKLPRTAVRDLPAEPAQREMILRQESNHRAILAVAILFAGGLMAYFPVRRFTRR